ncbi:MAG: response regulator [Synechococcales cyanobacterium M58_A2018_015]|nr:response regulator [Synechococcales cyanobacterium M58_A2018_015]
MVTSADILVVDDKPDNLRLLSSILTNEGFKVRKVLNGQLAIDAARIHPPDLILLDIMMPQPDGYQVCQDLKANPCTADIPIIFLSALDTVADKVKAFTAGGVDFISKPFQQEEVLARVKTHLQIRQLTKALQEQNQRLQAEIQQRRQVEAELSQALHELQATQEQIIVKEKLASLGALTAGIAHELRNPLNFVMNYAESSVELAAEALDELTAATSPLAESAPAPAIELPYSEPERLATLQEILSDLRDNATAIHQHGQRAERIIRMMMQHTRTEPCERKPTNLNELVAEALDLTYHSKRAQDSDFNVTIQTDYDPAVGMISVSASDLGRALINLIENACYALQEKYHQSPAGFTPTLLIQTRRHPEAVEIRIRDNGIGIPPEIQTKIFDPFFTTKAADGTGLGLSITYDVIVGQHQGTLKVTSQPQVFTEFLIGLPA